MEREYTIGGFLVLVTIFIIALIIYFTVPEFNNSVKQIADEVFGVSVKQQRQDAEEYMTSDAKKVFESLGKCIESLSKKSETCTCYLTDTSLPQGYKIEPLNEKMEELRLVRGGEGTIKVVDTPKLGIKNLKFCMLGKGLVKEDLSIFTINTKDGTDLRVNTETVVNNAPILYNLKDGNSVYLCFVTDKLTEQDIIKLRMIKDCEKGTKQLEEKVNKTFYGFLAQYKRCKEHSGDSTCKCGKMKMENIHLPYSLQVSQKDKETTFILGGTSEKETVKDNKLAKLIVWNYEGGQVLNYKTEDYSDQEKLKGDQDIIYFKDNKKIYLAEPDVVKGMELCFGKVNTYLEFDNTLTEEDYKQKVIKFKPALSSKEVYIKQVYNAAKASNIDFFMLSAMITKESDWTANAVSSKGAAGIVQLMPDTARGLGLKVPAYSKVGGTYICNTVSSSCDIRNDERFDSVKNINTASKHIKWIISELDKDTNLDATFENILAAYNAGLTAVKKAEGVPNIRETKNYVKSICGYYEQMNTKACYA
ncbi:lytic transglycosylase domain-containing protein [Candidatus Woesearchaeota archaeon]|nr:lytic transglycosylase domain-containing protein [Candidatus Woesearchaeota archaeon]